MSNETVVSFSNVTKSYKLYPNRFEQLKDIFKFGKIIEHAKIDAIKNLSLDIKKGERVAFIGRNGAGKSTVLKLMTGNFTPTQGNVIIKGEVQALMETGLGFHPEYTGRENINASLMFNNLTTKETRHAIDDIIDFVELGDFIDQPIKTYSLGMQSRLYFATATAIKPNILIIDEMMGAGDAYFSAKSSERMKSLTKEGCTLILVSHSTGQVLQFCSRAIWLECGEKMLEGDAFDVVKAYEEYTKKLELESYSNTTTGAITQATWLRKKLINEVLSGHSTPDIGQTEKKQNLAGNISRWPCHEKGLQINSIEVMNHEGSPNGLVQTNHNMSIKINIQAEKTGQYPCTFVLVLFTMDGRCLTRHCSKPYNLSLEQGENASVSLVYENTLLGNGEYVFSAGLYKELNLNDMSSARAYDLLSRSFKFTVLDNYPDDQSIFHHPSKWEYEVETEEVC